MRFELFFKNIKELRNVLEFYGKNRMNNVNIPCKAKLRRELLIEAIEITSRMDFQICPHFSIAYEFDRTKERTMKKLYTFIDTVHRNGVKEILLVSGGQRKALDSVSALRSLSRQKQKVHKVLFAVAFNPYLPLNEMSTERERLQQKLDTGLVSTVYLQFGTDLSRLRTEIERLRSSSRFNHHIKIIGSVFLPSRKFLAQFKFRPWRGVFCSERYLNDLEYAKTFTRKMLRCYEELGIEALVESALRTESEVHALSDLMVTKDEKITSKALTSTDLTSTSIDTCILVYTPYDLRVHDHVALNEAARQFDEVVPVFLYSKPEQEAEYSGYRVRPYVSEIWIRESLKDLERSLKKMESGLCILDSSNGISECLIHFIRDLNVLDKRRNVRAIYSGTRYEPSAREQNEIWAKTLEEKENVLVKFFNTSLLFDPRDVVEMKKKKNKGMRKQRGFAHWGTLMWFIKITRQLPPLSRPQNAPLKLNTGSLPESKITIMDLFGSVKWEKKILKSWKITESEGRAILRRFIKNGFASYEKYRSRLDISNAVSHLSPYLRHGNVSPRELHFASIDSGFVSKTFSRRLYWRDLAYFQHHTFPKIYETGIRKHYDETEWVESRAKLIAWKRGMTGFPLVDAGMRELYETGWMQQNIRMVVADFLVTYMGMNWVHGLQYFHECLVDADLAINSMMWQNAGRSGIDQWNFSLRPDKGESRDPKGKYVRKWVPELTKLPTRFLFAPWTSPLKTLQESGVILGENYPVRIVTDLEAARRSTTFRVLSMRRANLSRNDDGGYDLIDLPDGQKTRVFTKKSFRLNREGNLLTKNNSFLNSSKKKTTSTKKKKRKIMHQPKIDSFVIRSSTTP